MITGIQEKEHKSYRIMILGKLFNKSKKMKI